MNAFQVGAAALSLSPPARPGVAASASKIPASKLKTIAPMMRLITRSWVGDMGRDQRDHTAAATAAKGKNHLRAE